MARRSLSFLSLRQMAVPTAQETSSTTLCVSDCPPSAVANTRRSTTHVPSKFAKGTPRPHGVNCVAANKLFLASTPPRTPALGDSPCDCTKFYGAFPSEWFRWGPTQLALFSPDSAWENFRSPLPIKIIWSSVRRSSIDNWGF